MYILLDHFLSVAVCVVMSRITDSTRRHIIIPSRTGITLIVEQCMLNMEQCMLNMEQCMLVAQTGEYAPFQRNMLEKCFFFNYAFLMLQKADYAKRNASIMGLSLGYVRGTWCVGYPVLSLLLL